MADEKRMSDLALADILVGKQLWASRWLQGFGVESSWNLLKTSQTKRVQYVSILKNGTILLHFKDCAAPLNIYGKYLYQSKEEAEKHIEVCQALGTGE